MRWSCLYFGSARIARRDPSSGNIYYFLGDQLGSSRVITDSSGNIQNESDFYPYGGERVITSNITEDHKFAGMERDSETGLDHTQDRQYESSLGHWLSPDPTVGTASQNVTLWNRYSYVGGEPLDGVDTEGNEFDCLGDDSDGFDFFPISPCYDVFGDFLESGDCSYFYGYYTIYLLYVGSPPPTVPNCYALATEDGPPTSTFNYNVALEIWDDGDMATYGTDAQAAAVASMAAVTWYGEDNFNLNPKNRGPFTLANGSTATDYGPFQIDSYYNPNAPVAVTGMAPGGQTFNGNPDANIAYGIGLLENLYWQYSQNAAEATGHYVGSLGINPKTGNPTRGQNRANLYEQYGENLWSLFRLNTAFLMTDPYEKGSSRTANTFSDFGNGECPRAGGYSLSWRDNESLRLPSCARRGRKLHNPATAHTNRSSTSDDRNGKVRACGTRFCARQRSSDPRSARPERMAYSPEHFP